MPENLWDNRSVFQGGSECLIVKLDFSFVPLCRFAFAFAALAPVSSALAQDAQFPTKDIVAELAVDFDSDGIPDRLIFTRNADGGAFVDLNVFKGVKEFMPGTKPPVPI